jgi:hypothetical protein
MCTLLVLEAFWQRTAMQQSEFNKPLTKLVTGEQSSDANLEENKNNF